MSYCLIKEDWINGNVMLSPRADYNHMEINYCSVNTLAEPF